MSQTFTCCKCGFSRPRKADIDSRTFVEGENPDEDVCIDCWWDKKKDDAVADILSTGVHEVEVAPGVTIRVDYTQ